jgi:hypothetical protein
MQPKYAVMQPESAEIHLRPGDLIAPQAVTDLTFLGY